MLKLCRVTKVKMLFLVLVYIFNFDLFEFLAAILNKGLLKCGSMQSEQREIQTMHIKLTLQISFQ